MSDESRPQYIGLHLTNRCNGRCRHCRIWRAPVGDEIDFAWWQKALIEIREWLGPLEIQIAGGEPLMSPHLAPLVREATRLGLSTTITSNGIALLGEFANELAAAGLGHVMLSLDGFDHVHNYLRRRDDAFALVERAISHVHDNGMAVGLNCVISAANLDILPGFVTWVAADKRLDGVFFQAFAQPFGEPPRDDWRCDEPLWPSDPAHAAAVLSELIAMKRAGFPILNREPQLAAMARYFAAPEAFARARCDVGAFGMTLLGTGSIQLCGRFAPIGDLRDGAHLRDVYRGPRAVAARQAMAACRENCHLLLNCCFTEESA